MKGEACLWAALVGVGGAGAVLAFAAAALLFTGPGVCLNFGVPACFTPARLGLAGDVAPPLPALGGPFASYEALAQAWTPQLGPWTAAFPDTFTLRRFARNASAGPCRSFATLAAFPLNRTAEGGEACQLATSPHGWNRSAAVILAAVLKDAQVAGPRNSHFIIFGLAAVLGLFR